MDWTALRVSLALGLGTIVLLLPFGIWLGRLLAVREFRGKLLVEALVTVPLVLPPTVLGFYLLVTFGARSPLGEAFESIVGQSLAFSFEGLLLASAIANIPFVVQPIQRGFEGIPADVLAAALDQAKEARTEILANMNACISEPRAEVAATAPKIISITIPMDKIGEVIGPKGKVINSIQSETGADISVDDIGADLSVDTIEGVEVVQQD